MPRYAPILVLAATVPTLAACGSSNSNSPNSPTAASKRASAFAFAACMRSHGVPNFPDPGGNGRGGLEIQASQRAGSGQSMKVNGVPVNAPAFQSAQQACQSKLPNGGRPTAAQLASMKSTALRFSACMRSHGVPNFPDPQFQPGGGVLMQLNGGSVAKNSPAFQSAQRQCGSIIGRKGGVQDLATGP